MLRSWTVPISLDPSSEVPIYQQIARVVAEEVQRGRLSPGTPLPGTRAMSELLGVHRNTVTAAYQELIAQGWASTEPSRGTFVSRQLPELPLSRDPVRAQVLSNPSFAVAPAPWSQQTPALPPGLLQFTDGTPDARLLPVAALSRAYRRALLQQTRRGLQYSGPQGHEGLRRAIAEMLRTKRAVVASEERIIVTRGSQMALYLTAQALVSPGDVVAIEQLGYRPAWEAFRLAGAQLVSLPVDRGGLRVDQLEKLCTRQRVRAVLLTPHHQYPTTVTLEACRRLQLLQLAARQGMAVVEDDYDHEFHYEGKPILPLASADHQSLVVYIGTFTKLLAPGIRLGYVLAPQSLIARMAALRTLIDRQGDIVLEAAIAELMADGELQAHARKARREYLQRRDILADLLTKKFGARVEFTLPPGGMALWVSVRERISTEQWAQAAQARGVVFAPGSTYALEGVCPSAVRLGYASLTPSELREAVERLQAAYPARRPRS